MKLMRGGDCRLPSSARRRWGNAKAFLSLAKPYSYAIINGITYPPYISPHAPTTPTLLFPFCRFMGGEGGAIVLPFLSPSLLRASRPLPLPRSLLSFQRFISIFILNSPPKTSVLSGSHHRPARDEQKLSPKSMENALKTGPFSTPPPHLYPLL